MIFVRWESPVLNNYGGHTGVFGLANGLARSGQLSPDDWAWWRSNHDWLDVAYPDPATIDPTLFDRATNPVTSCWFKDTAEHLPRRGHFRLTRPTQRKLRDIADDVLLAGTLLNE